MSEPPAATPRYDKNEVPWCVETCPAHDGKRCELTGFRPDAMCEPAVILMAAQLRDVRAIVSP